MKRYALMTLCFAAGVLLAQPALAQPEKTASGAAPAPSPAAKRLIVPGDLLQVTIESGPEGGRRTEVFRWSVRSDGRTEVANNEDQRNIFYTPMASVLLSGLTEAQAETAITKVMAEAGHGEGRSVTVALLAHVESAAVGLIVNPQLATMVLETAVSLSDPSRFVQKAAIAAGLDPNRCSIESMPIVYSGNEVAGRGGAAGGAISVTLKARVRGGDRKDAQALARAACDEVASAFRAWGREAARPMVERLDELERQQSDNKKQCDDMNTEVSRILGDYASVAEYRKAIQTAAADADSLRVAAESEEVRRDRLGRLSASIRKKMEETAKTDPIAAELEKVVTLREQASKAAENLHKVGRSSDAEFGETQEKLAMARVELLRRREEVGRSAGGEELAEVTKQSISAEVAAATAKARYYAVRGRLEEMKADQKVRKLEELQRTLDDLARGREGNQKAIDDLTRMLTVPAVQAVPAIVPGPAREKAPAARPAK